MLGGLRRPKPSPTTLVATALAVLAVAALAIGATPAGAQGNSGTIKVHDGVAADPPQRNEPHVTGDAFVEGFNMAVDGGTLRFFSWPPTGDRTLVLDTTWSADGGEPEFHFLAGPFDLPCGHYRVEAGNAGDHVKSKMFWVECPASAPPSPTPTPTPSPTGSGSATSTSTTTTTSPPPQPGGLECPTDVTATANGDETVTLRWTPAEGADGTNIYRAIGGDDFEYVTTVPGDVSSYVDDATVAGNGYAYQLTTLEGNSESRGCPIVEVTAIPEFPTVVALGLASALGAGAYLVLAVRRKLP